MPKIVDHEKQKQTVAEATWRIILREGIEVASVRRIADEANISPGSMRHYFSSQTELLAFSMNLVSERVKTRMQNIEYTGDPFQDSLLLMDELLPLNEEKRAEMEVWLKFNVKALSEPTLYSFASTVYEEMKVGIGMIVNSLMELGLMKKDLDTELETERLYALIDGLALHGIMQPKRLPSEKIKEVVIRHLTSICNTHN